MSSNYRIYAVDWDWFLLNRDEIILPENEDFYDEIDEMELTDPSSKTPTIVLAPLMETDLSRINIPDRISKFLNTLFWDIVPEGQQCLEIQDEATEDMVLVMSPESLEEFCRLISDSDISDLKTDASQGMPILAEYLKDWLKAFRTANTMHRGILVQCC